MKVWAARKNKNQFYHNNTSTSTLDETDPVGVALTLSRRMVSILKEKRIINIEANLEMIALGMTICSEVRLFYIYLNHLIFFSH